MRSQGIVRAIVLVMISSLSLTVTNASARLLLVNDSALEKSNQQLADIKAQIKKQTQALDKKIAEKSTLEDTFKRSELKVSELVIALQQTQNQLNSVKDKVIKLTAILFPY